MSLLIGLCDSACPGKRASSFTNKIGGLPDFFASVSLSAPPICHVCGSKLVLLVQAYCPLESSQYHRLFHVFCCISVTCRSNSTSWLVLRSQELDKGPDTIPNKDCELTSVSVQEWCNEAEDWESDTEDNNEPTNIIEQKLLPSSNSLSVQETPSSVSPNHYTSSYDSPSYNYPSFFLNVFAESELFKPESTSKNDTSEYRSLYSNTVGSNTAGSIESIEDYEQTSAAHGDKLFMKFKKEVSKCPNQIIRYQKGGIPLLCSDINGSPSSVNCKSCGGNSTFEFQIMPQLIYLLQESIRQQSIALQSSGAHVTISEPMTILGDDKDLQVVEFGTVLVYTCDNSCWINTDNNDSEQNNFREETVLVQPGT